MVRPLNSIAITSDVAWGVLSSFHPSYLQHNIIRLGLSSGRSSNDQTSKLLILLFMQCFRLLQVVLAPSLPDGSGPDLSRQVSQGPPQVCRLDSMPTCLAALAPLKCGHCPSPSRGMEDGRLQGENGGEIVTVSNATFAQGEESSTASSSSSSNEKPPVPPISQNSSPLSSTSSNTRMLLAK